MRLASQWVRWTLIFSLISLVAGCGSSLVSPPPTDGSGGGSTGGGTGTSPQLGPEIMVVHADGTVSWTQPPMDWSANAAILEPTAEPLRQTVSMVIDGSLGGRMECGRFFLTVPPLAFDGKGTVTMTTIDSTVQICDVEISPATLNGFKEPVSLGLNTTGLSVDCDSLTMYWYDPDHKTWVDMGAVKDPTNVRELMGVPLLSADTGMATSVRHFSRYGGGKAGW